MISIVSAIYKSDRYIERYEKEVLKFAAMLKQSGRDFELLIRATIPSEKEKLVFGRLAKNLWCNVAEVQRRGAYAAWNEGVLAARGDVVGFWNVDDIRFPQAVMEAEDLVKNGADVVYFPFIIKRYVNVFGLSIRVYVKRIDGAVLDFDVKKFSRGMVCGPHFMFRRQLYYDIGPFDEQFKFASDFDWCVRALEHTKKFSRGQQLSGIFRVDGTGLSSGSLPWRDAENNIVFKRHGQNDLIVPSDPVQQEKYKTEEFLFREKWHQLSELLSLLRKAYN